MHIEVKYPADFCIGARGGLCAPARPLDGYPIDNGTPNKGICST